MCIPWKTKGSWNHRLSVYQQNGFAKKGLPRTKYLGETVLGPTFPFPQLVPDKEGKTEVHNAVLVFGELEEGWTWFCSGHISRRPFLSLVGVFKEFVKVNGVTVGFINLSYIYSVDILPTIG
jgi:hypothetical protein